MENEEQTLDIQEEQQENEIVLDEESTTEVVETEESVEDKLAKAEAEANKYRRLFEKTQKPKVVTPQAPQPASPNVEEVVLLANGMSEELLGELKAVAKVRGTSLIKAQNDPIFVALKENFEKEIKQKSASLGASRGAGAVKPKVTLSTPGLSREEHRRLTMEL